MTTLDVARPASPPAYGAETVAAVLKIITEHPELHDQGAFEDATNRRDGVCRTTRCVAGWAYWLHRGALPVVMHDCGLEDCSSRDQLQGVDSFVVTRLAREALGLDYGDDNYLFFRCNDDEAVQALRYLAAGKNVYGR